MGESLDHAQGHARLTPWYLHWLMPFAWGSKACLENVYQARDSSSVHLSLLCEWGIRAAFWVWHGPQAHEPMPLGFQPPKCIRTATTLPLSILVLRYRIILISSLLIKSVALSPCISAIDLKHCCSGGYSCFHYYLTVCIVTRVSLEYWNWCF